ncbi:5781_t:CDS:2 [Gigaspora margarita]|uniref:5781_t:CDS:1 n=1 Tax=Gigaspora margarita TaxID=4874 RepID=A0ABM8W5N3_GIGMA|nr:5781_t:CDS:2 [Gigaspora margarita]
MPILLIDHLHKEFSRNYQDDKHKPAILEAFQSADAIIPTLSTELPTCPKDKLTSKLLNFKNLTEAINSPTGLIKIHGSRKWDISISDDYYNNISSNKKIKYQE